MSKPRSLGVLLCYNDADILEDAILHLLNASHDLIVWDHGSDDGTEAVLDRYHGQLAERKFIPRSFDFYKLYQAMSEHLIRNFIDRYDWISWPDQDELLEGPDRSKGYQDWVASVYEEGYDYVQFNNFNFWFTSDDDPAIASPVQRVRHYSLVSRLRPAYPGLAGEQDQYPGVQSQSRRGADGAGSFQPASLPHAHPGADDQKAE